MIVVNQIIGNRADMALENREIDLLELEWFESTKRIQRKVTAQGQEIAIKFMREGQRLRQDDILYLDAGKAVLVHIRPCDAIVLSPASMLEMGTVCYEIGNKHLPLFIENDQVMMPFEHPMFRWLEASGYRPEKQFRQLLHLLKSNVEPHGHGGAENSLFNKIINLASQVSGK